MDPGEMGLDEIQDDCPMKEILKQLATVIELTANVVKLQKRILDHCDNCPAKGNAPQS